MKCILKNTDLVFLGKINNLKQIIFVYCFIISFYFWFMLVVSILVHLILWSLKCHYNIV